MKSALIIASNSEVAQMIRSELPPDCHSEHTESIQSALRLHRRYLFDVIFSDLSILGEGSPAKEIADAIKPFRESNFSSEFIVLTSKESIRQAVMAVEAGAANYLTYPIHPSEVRLVVDSLNESRTANLELDYLRDQFWKSEWLAVIQTKTDGMRAVFKKIRAVAPTRATVLLMGETGTGKGLLARVIHRHSHRCDAPFISVHCGAIPDTLLESELFGHEKGAFTGAVRRKPGKFEMSRGGTIFLDEIGTISAPAQVKMLQVLQDGTFSRVGGEQVLQTDARVIAATNADLSGMTAKGEFRKDLYYRLNVFAVEVPPLRDRAEDIPYLMEVFLKKLNQNYGKNIQGVDPRVIRALKNYSWPGNIRELENLMERAYILESTPLLTSEGFPDELFESEGQAAVLPVNAHLTLAEARRRAVEKFERQYLIELFARNRGRVNSAARDAGISARQLNKLMVKYSIQKETFKDSSEQSVPDKPREQY